MEDFCRIAVASPQIRVGDISFNTEVHCEMIDEAFSMDASVVVFPSLSLTGCTASDLIDPFMLHEVEESIKRIAKFTYDKNILALCGLPVWVGGSVCHGVAAAFDGKLIGVTVENARVDTITLAGQSIPCGHIVYKTGTLFSLSVQNFLASPSKGAAAITVCSGKSYETPFLREQIKSALLADSIRLSGAMVYCGAAHESTYQHYYGGRKAVAECGEIIAEEGIAQKMVYADIDLGKIAFKRIRNTVKYEHSQVIDVDIRAKEIMLKRYFSALPFVPANNFNHYAEQIICTQAAALAHRLKQTGCKPVIGISGGLDSTLALLVSLRAVELLGRTPDTIIAVTMQGFGTGKETAASAANLIKASGAVKLSIPISSVTKHHLTDIGHSLKPDVTYENAQARMRTLVLMNVANMRGGIVIGTGDLSELALGWCTYSGDQMSHYSVNASVPKTLVRALVEYEKERLGENKLMVKALSAVLGTAISPELLPSIDGKIAQKTEEILGSYDVHDFFIYHKLSGGADENKLLLLAKEAFKNRFNEEQLSKWLGIFIKRFYTNQFKRSCAPDGVNATGFSLAPHEYNIPSDL